MKRIAFLKLGMTLVVSEAWLSGCASSDDDASSGAGATGGEASGGSPSGGAGAAGNAVSAGSAGTSDGGNGATAGMPSGGSAAVGGQAATEMMCSTDAHVLQTSKESHDHLPLTSPITAAQLNGGSPREFATAFEQDHIHTLTFSETDFVALRAGMVIVKRSSSMMGHTHTYTIQCV